MADSQEATASVQDATSLAAVTADEKAPLSTTESIDQSAEAEQQLEVDGVDENRDELDKHEASDSEEVKGEQTASIDQEASATPPANAEGIAWEDQKQQTSSEQDEERRGREGAATTGQDIETSDEAADVQSSLSSTLSTERKNASKLSQEEQARQMAETAAEDELQRRAEDAYTSQLSVPEVEEKGLSSAENVTVVEEIDEEKQAVIQQVLKAYKEKQNTISLSETYQFAIVEYFRKQKQLPDTTLDEKNSSETEARYIKSLQATCALLDKLDKINDVLENNRSIASKDTLQKETYTNAIRKDYLDAVRKTASIAQFNRQGKTIPVKTLAKYETDDLRKDDEIKQIRLENFVHRNRLKRQEEIIKKKEQLAEGLHLVDFEQLKVENKTYNEKIEERNEELARLNKKIMNAVQILTHMKEKHDFLQLEVDGCKESRDSTDRAVLQKRDELNHLKQTRDKLRADNIILHQKSGLLSSRLLLEDFEDQRNKANSLKEKLQQLQSTYRHLTSIDSPKKASIVSH